MTRKMTRKMVCHGAIVYRYNYCPTGKRRGCTTPVMISEDELKQIVSNNISQHIERAKTLSKEIEQMADKEILYLFTKNKLAEINGKHTELQKLQEYKSSLQISGICGIISAEDCKDMEKSYMQKILTLEGEISKVAGQIQVTVNCSGLYI